MARTPVTLAPLIPSIMPSERFAPKRPNERREPVDRRELIVAA
jgi:hypothetical protein